MQGLLVTCRAAGGLRSARDDAALVAFNLIELDHEDIHAEPLVDRKNVSLTKRGGPTRVP